jgi:anti-sigma-K factor RskA
MDVHAIHELAAGYALDALDPDERAAFDAHLEGCAECRETVAALAGAATSLAYAVEGPAPPPELRGRILTAARAERGDVVPLRRRWAPEWAAAVAAAAALALGLGLWATLTPGGSEGGEPHIVALQGAEGSLSVGTSGRAFLTVSGLRPAPAGKTYEIWVIEKGAPLPAGLFSRGGRVIVPVQRRVPPGATVAVTLEQAGGADSPRGDVLFSATVPV